jgi:8-oxo-dGTP pyrophosphatase MutT (NUDIX family)
VLKREIKEELGTGVDIKVNKLAFVSKRQYTKNGVLYRTLAIFYNAEFIGGKISLSNEHKISEWVKPADLLAKNNKYMTKDEEDQLKKYFSA